MLGAKLRDTQENKDQLSNQMERQSLCEKQTDKFSRKTKLSLGNKTL